jgi:hypothetical protein
MAEFIKDQICVISIVSGNPYDSSKMENNANTFYTQINYKQLKELYDVIRYQKITDNITYQTIQRYIEEKKAKVFFDIKCSSDCHSGSHFTDDETTLSMFKMVNTMTRLGCNVVVGDHSMASLFNNWDKYRMDIPSPIEVMKETTEGSYKMSGNKIDFQSSDYPILKNLGDMSADEKIEIDFRNMSGTKIYKIKEDTQIPVKVISKGGKGLEQNEIVHSEFAYRNGKIIISATHWCNLRDVKTEVNVEEMTRQYETQFGVEETLQMRVQYSCAIASGNKEEMQRVVSDSVRYMCSGQK